MADRPGGATGELCAIGSRPADGRGRGGWRVRAALVCALAVFPSGVAEAQDAGVAVAVPRADLLRTFSASLEVLTRSGDVQPQLFREGTIHVERLPDGIRTRIEYRDGDGPTGSFDIQQDPGSLGLRRFEYRAASWYGSRRALWTEGGHLLRKNGRLSRTEDLGAAGDVIFPPENKEWILALVEPTAGAVLRLPLAGFGTPARGDWQVRYTGAVQVDVSGGTVQAHRWESVGNGALIDVVDRPPYVLGFRFTDPSGVEWIHRVICEGGMPGTDALQGCVQKASSPT